MTTKTQVCIGQKLRNRVIYLPHTPFHPFLQANGDSLRGMNHKNAVAALRLASSPVEITVLRDEPEAVFTSIKGIMIQ